MVQLVLSLDYEIFGNGSGDVMRDVIRPTARLLDICERHGAKLTIMFEVGEYWAFERYDAQLQQDLGYSPSEAMTTQATEAIKRGHDVQLHLHPWWIGATIEHNRWRLHPEYKRITDLPNGLGCGQDLFSVIGVLCKGKQTLEMIARPGRQDYDCLAYRAAMFWGQPSGEVIRDLKTAGFVADSSVISGLYEATPVPTDYRQAVSAAGYWWTSGEDISQVGPRGGHIIEFPVYSRLMPYVCNLKWTKVHTTLKRRFQERSNTHGHGMMDARQSTEPLGKVIRKLGTLQPMKYDFCKLSSRDMIRWLRRLMKGESVGGDDCGTPVVMLGHSKDFWNDLNVAAFLKCVKEECADVVRFSTLGECTKRILERDTPLQRESAHNVISQGPADRNAARCE